MSLKSHEARKLALASVVAMVAVGAAASPAHAQFQVAFPVAAVSAAAADTEAPSQPGNPVITDLSPTGAKLTWEPSTDNVGVVSYDVTYDEITVNTKTPSITLAGLIPDSEYYVEVTAIDAAGNRSESNYDAFFVTPLGTVDTVAPVAPKAPTASNVTTSAVTLTWPATTDNVGVVGYDILQDGVVAASTPANVLTTTITGLTANTSYKYTVQARDFAGNKGVSPASTVKTLSNGTPVDTTAPSAPGTPSASAITENTATLSWAASTDNVGVVGYDVYDGSTKIASTTGATTVALTGLSKATSYSLTVKAKDAAGNTSSSSAAGTFKTAGDIIAPSAPGTPAASNITENSATLSWGASTDNVGVTGYDVYNGTTKVASTTGATSVSVTGLSKATDYSFTVKAKDAGGNVSSSSAAGTFKTAGDIIPPSAPGTPTASNITETTATLSWGASTDNVGVTGYDVYNGSTKIASTTGATSVSLTGLVKATSYSLTVKAKDAGGNVSSSSAAGAFKTAGDIIAPSNPGTPTASAITETTATLSWAASTDNVGVTGYDVFNGTTKVASTTGATSINLTDLVKGTSYSYTVKAKDAAGNVSGASAVGTFRTTGGGSTPIKYSYNLKGSATLKTLTKGALPLTGGVDAELTLNTGAVSADLQLNPTKGRLTALGFLPVTATVAFVTNGKTTGTLNDNGLVTTSLVRIKLPSVTLFGTVPLAGGTNCQTKSYSKIVLTDPLFDALDGGTLRGNFAISDLSGCGILNGIVSPITAGSGNTITAALTRK